ncbi:dihydrolipoamide acyltransferase component E2 (DLAT) [Plasmodium ovale wallikeri]|uniref:Dihydrolipoamide acetyltransferase component of pyruvate dehydrogenase complex n=1 Tax=Plasmodium ovale wallikeri TaxID=864142 RepID=A0A1A8YNX6_PLAOA|nr:dihydrolipoamide acyltransferase component E2 (DLAT) [Plasmodium ovale wallikeri]
MDVEAFDEGFLRVKHLGDGCEANVGDTLGILTTEEDEKIDDIQVTHDSNDACKSEDDTDNDIEGERNVGMIQEGAYEEKIYVPFTRTKKNRVRINKWVYKENNFVNKDEILFHVEDDKSTIEVESPHTGVIKKILVKEGDFADLDKEIAIISVKKESGKILNEENANNHPMKSEDIDEDNILTHYKNVLSGSREGQLFLKSLRSPESGGSEKSETEKEGSQASDVKIVLPSAAELMQRNKLTLSDITKTKTPNRVTYEDVDNFLKSRKSSPAKEDSKEENEKLINLTSMQRSIKNNMMLTLGVPVFRVTHLMKTNELIKLYEKVKEKISVSVILNKCVSTVLLKHPLIYSTYIESDQGKIKYNRDVNIGNALGLKDSLLTPVLKQVDKKDIYSLSDEWKKLVEKGKNGLLTPNDISGSNFYISNLGMFNTYQFDAILPKNASCILSIGTNIGSIENFQDIKIYRGMMMTLTCDHRHIYGAHAASFMNDLSKFIECDIMQIFL